MFCWNLTTFVGYILYKHYNFGRFCESTVNLLRIYCETIAESITESTAESINQKYTNFYLILYTKIR